MTIVPHDRIEPQTLRALIEEFVTRSGAVHGQGDVALERQVHEVLGQLRSGLAVVVYDEENEFCTIVPRNSLTPTEPGRDRANLRKIKPRVPRGIPPESI